MSTLQTIAVSKLSRQLQTLAAARGLAVERLVEPVLQEGIRSVNQGAEIQVDVGKPSDVIFPDENEPEVNAVKRLSEWDKQAA